jgi:hypothetical protein
MRRPFRLWLLTLGFLCGCSSAVKVDVDCPRLCLAQPGQALPGFQRFVPKGWDADISTLGAVLSHVAAAFDGGSALASNFMSVVADAYPGVSVTVLPDGSAMAVDWLVEMDFDEILAQVPSSSINLAARVQVSSAHLTSAGDLSFIESAELYLGRRPKSSGTARARDASAATNTNCSAVTSGLPIADYHRTGASFATPALELAIQDGALNVFDCMSGAMTVFSLRMSIPADSYPATDTALSLESCLSMEAHASYP